MKELSGIIPPTLIPFDTNGAINEGSLRDLIDFQIERGIGGLFPGGTFGSGPLMSVNERKKCAELQKKQSRLVGIMRIGGTPITSLIAMYELRGYEFGYPHDPMIKVSPNIKEKIKQGLLKLGLL